MTTTQTTDRIIPKASLQEEWSVSTVEQLAWSIGRPIARYSRVQESASRTRRAEALLRLATDPAATAAERMLAAHRLADLRAASRRQAS